MRAYVGWIKSLKGTPVFVAYPAGFDFLFAYWPPCSRSRCRASGC